jgi:hypothetical protein
MPGLEPSGFSPWRMITIRVPGAAPSDAAEGVGRLFGAAPPVAPGEGVVPQPASTGDMTRATIVVIASSSARRVVGTSMEVMASCTSSRDDVQVAATARGSK